MGKSRGHIPISQKEVIRCIDCWRKYTKFMSIKISQFKNEYKCIRCYNGGNYDKENDIRAILSKRHVDRLFYTYR